MGGHLGSVTVTSVAVPSGAWTKILTRNANRRELRILNNESGADIYYQFSATAPTATTGAVALADGEIESWQDEDVPLPSVWAYQTSGAPITVKVEEGV